MEETYEMLRMVGEEEANIWQPSDDLIYEQIKEGIESLPISRMSHFAEMMAYPWSGVVISALTFSAMYVLVCATPGFRERKFGFKTRVVCIVHALITMSLALKLAIFASPFEIGGPNTPGQLTVVNVAGGFFLYDIISWIFYGYSISKYDYSQLFHHFSCLIGMWACWSTGHSGADCSMALLIAEFANPFMYLRYLLRDRGLMDTPLAQFNQLLFAIAMTITIPIAAPILAILILMEPRSHPIHQFAAVGLVAVNLMWFFKFMGKFLSPSASTSFSSSTMPIPPSTAKGPLLHSPLKATGAGGHF